ncbi:adenylosuccinate synthase [Spiroplasma endosymbiont of Labia minor]|uniref:adenylosuccinate synthase n=1 Tax=Spiroplasma endosymbiont of Labia minor TaxID=3066305 RepID=UPI0030D3C297
MNKNESQDYRSLVIVGAQWGDEGKGKITDYFAQSADMVVRFAGGNNAGHIIEQNGKKLKVTIVPSGIMNSRVINVIGNGTVINLPSLISEMEILEKEGFITDTIKISNRAHLVFPYHIVIDEFQEKERKNKKIGTTKRGIGPAYSDKVDRQGIRICDIAKKDFKEKLKYNVEYKNKFIKAMFDGKPLNFEDIYNETIELYKKIEDKITDTAIIIEDAIKSNKTVLFEGAQGVLLDIDHGTYPFVTSSNTSANNAPTGAGISANLIKHVIGVAKAYCTRVGAGGFPTELLSEIGDQIREKGHEYGSNTGRPRRVGWLDAVALKYAIKVGGITNIFITLLDVLSGLEKIKICTSYTLNNRQINSLPACDEDYQECIPNFLEMPGWNEDITQVKSFDELPENAKNYLKMIEKICEIDIIGFSIGPDRKQTILLDQIFNHD